MIELGNLDDIVALRHDLHAHPETAYEEYRTAGIVAENLRSWGIEVHTGIAKTGLVGVLRRGSASRAIMLRADMDALPMQEDNTFAHRSTHPGKMHGCGHDGHTAMLLAAARHLARSGGFDGTVYFLFQPAEENGGAGARAMMREGLFERFPTDAVFGIHNWPGMSEGHVGVCPGPLMAAANAFKITITGRGGHAAAPHHCADPVPPLFAVGQAIQTILTRSKNPIDAAVISITQVQAGGSVANIIPGSAWLGGAVRAYGPAVVDLIERRLNEMATAIAQAHDCRADVHFERRYPAVINAENETEFVLNVMREVVGEHKTHIIEPVMVAEDFSFYLQKKPGCYFFLGAGDGEHRDAGHGLGPCALHNGSYDFNDRVIPVGVSLWIRLVQRFLA
ncbi:Hydrolase [Bordetella sputigena]|uniref:M20 aminoacylase family protein n=1 Tax=Bordetella sputigena TaxID=1416810 RepID=UPI0039EEDA23